MFYLITVFLIFAFAMVLQIPKLKIDANTKMIVFLIWAVYGVVPTFHWTYTMGGMENPVVQVSQTASLLLLGIIYKCRKRTYMVTMFMFTHPSVFDPVLVTKPFVKFS